MEGDGCSHEGQDLEEGTKTTGNISNSIPRTIMVPAVEEGNHQGHPGILVSFPTYDALQLFLKDKATWNSWFKCLEPWSGQHIEFERIAWIKIHGSLHNFGTKMFSIV
ncbi:hypothetical protein QVD17_08146 [Tagetes erecta]|uniref:Uncharacterized protein n=1 Tax=Tagetes erecta TaxID=13708 RepID=A0AAD8P4F7_TARER|nr:hypothetical protein QVD17_08146 [Tagetes erecta]